MRNASSWDQKGGSGEKGGQRCLGLQEGSGGWGAPSSAPHCLETTHTVALGPKRGDGTEAG
jgi:hypothetical protein